MGSTIIDVARLCGYSKATVSRAFASPEVVSDKAKEKIFAAAKELNYSPDAIARAMVRQRTDNITFIIHEKQYPAILNPFYSRVLESVMQESTARGYSLFISPTQNMYLPNGDVFIRKQMDGVILAGEADSRIIKKLKDQKIPTVLLNNYLDMDGLVCVTADHIQGAESAVEHLISKGHSRIGFIGGHFSKQVREARYNGYVNVMNRHGLSIPFAYVVEIEPTLEESIRVVGEMLKGDDRPTAFFCTNDTIAIGAEKAVIRAGLKIPKDVAIVGYDDSLGSKLVEPELTTVQIDAESMGRIAARSLFDQIEGTGVSGSVQISTKLMIRETT